MANSGHAESNDVVAVLTDSRGFDTYYLNDRYETWYGADKTFAHRLGRRLLLERAPPVDTVHIPDHFRSGTIENNLLRLGLCDPSYVVLCDGIWETLLNRELLIDYVTEQIRESALGDPDPLRLEVSHQAVTELFLAGKLAISPALYAARIGRIVSYFARRRRAVCWLSLLVPSPDHKDGIHYAGDYKCLPGWGRCLEAVNQSVKEMLLLWGATYVDLQALMAASGGETACLLDQWHFTEAFHQRVADSLYALVTAALDAAPLAPDHASHAAIVPGKAGGGALVVIGDAAQAWCRQVEGRFDANPVSLGDAARLEAATIVLVDPVEKRDETARDLLDRCPPSTIVIYPEEIDGIENPPPSTARATPRGGER
jgi:hypothetical protein